MDPEPDLGSTRIDSSRIHKFKTKSYLESFINPPEYIEKQKSALRDRIDSSHQLPPAPVKDVLAFLIKYAPLNSWERAVLEIIREEAYYFAPQKMTKIMNEGWATYWHSKFMTEKLLEPSEVINYADVFSGITYQAPGQLNPYKMGLELFRHIEERWDKGRFGFDYQNCKDLVTKKQWNKKVGLGREKIFEVRKHFSDVTFLDEFFTQEFVEEKLFYTYDYNKR
jgi:stage V sporulation protein R